MVDGHVPGDGWAGANIWADDKEQEADREGNGGWMEQNDRNGMQTRELGLDWGDVGADGGGGQTKGWKGVYKVKGHFYTLIPFLLSA